MKIRSTCGRQLVLQALVLQFALTAGGAKGARGARHLGLRQQSRPAAKAAPKPEPAKPRTRSQRTKMHRDQRPSLWLSGNSTSGLTLPPRCADELANPCVRSSLTSTHFWHFFMEKIQNTTFWPDSTMTLEIFQKTDLTS